MSTESIITFETRGSITIGTILAGSVLDALNVAEFGKTALEYVKAHPGVALLLSFDQVEYLSSAVLAELIRVNRAINETHGALRLCALNANIRKVFEITNLDRVFTIDPDVETALRRFPRALKLRAEDEAWQEGVE